MADVSLQILFCIWCVHGPKTWSINCPVELTKRGLKKFWELCFLCLGLVRNDFVCDLVVLNRVKGSRSWIRLVASLHTFHKTAHKTIYGAQIFRSTLDKWTHNGVSSRAILFNAMIVFHSAHFFKTVFCKSRGWIMFRIAVWHWKCFEKSYVSALSLPKPLRNNNLSWKHQNHWIDTNSGICSVLQVVLSGTRRCCMELALGKNGPVASIQKHLVLQPISGIY